MKLKQWVGARQDTFLYGICIKQKRQSENKECT